MDSRLAIISVVASKPVYSGFIAHQWSSLEIHHDTEAWLTHTVIWHLGQASYEAFSSTGRCNLDVLTDRVPRNILCQGSVRICSGTESADTATGRCAWTPNHLIYRTAKTTPKNSWKTKQNSSLCRATAFVYHQIKASSKSPSHSRSVTHSTSHKTSKANQ